MSLPNGTIVAFTYDANGNRTEKSVTPSGGSATITNDTYQNNLLQYETTGSGTLLASFTYDGSGVPVSVRVGTDPNNSPIYYYVYNGHGDVDALTDSQGNVVASYSYDDWGNLTSASESIPNANGWTNPYRYDGHDRVRYDPRPMPPAALLLHARLLARRGLLIERGAIVRQAPPIVPPGLPHVKADPYRARLRSARHCGAALTAAAHGWPTGGEPGGARRADQQAHTAAARSAAMMGGVRTPFAEE